MTPKGFIRLKCHQPDDPDSYHTIRLTGIQGYGEHPYVDDVVEITWGNGKTFYYHGTVEQIDAALDDLAHVP